MSIHPKKPKNPKTTTINTNDDNNLQSDIANFASSLGLSSSLPSSGFNDTSFRNPKAKNPSSKSTPKNAKNEIKPNKSQQSNIPNNPRKKPFNAVDSNKNAQNPRNPNFENSKDSRNQPKPRSQNIFAVDNSRSFDKYKNLPKLPLMKASALGVWYSDAAELEEKVIGDKKKGVKGVEEWKELVEKKRELGERLLWQFVSDYEGTRAQSGDIKMVLATQRSGTVTDKVSAFSVLVGDNCIANIKSIDALIGMVTSKVGKRYAFTGFEALKEMFISRLISSYC
ncbi:CCAAT/enhancer-binding protein zeta [Tanacetum coccineum]